MRGGERPEGGGEHEQERGPRVAQRPTGDLASTHRGHEAAPTGQHPLGDLRDARDDPDRDHRPGQQPDRGRRDQQRVHPERAPGVAGDRGAVEAQLEQRQGGEEHEREIEAQPLRQGPPDLSSDRGPDPGER